MTGSTKIYPVSRLYSSAADLTNGDLKTIKQRLETVGIEPSRLLAEWMKKSLGLELDIPPEKGDSVSVEGAEKRRQIEKSTK